jgi:cytochrome c-type biogenesis protein CcmH
MRRLAAIALLLTAIGTSSSLAVQPDEMLKDPALEARARELSRELRCMVCQNQSIDESDAPLARDLRLLVRERLTKGDTNKQVLDFLVVRYGEFVLLKPPLDGKTIVLWALPPIALLAGAIGLYFAGRRRRAGQAEPATLSNDEQLKLSTLVDKHRADP